MSSNTSSASGMMSSAPKSVAKKVVAKKVSNKISKKVAKKSKDNWTCEDDGDFHAWTHEGVSYVRDYNNRVFRDREGGVESSDWVGIFNPATNEFESAPLPEEFLDN